MNLWSPKMRKRHAVAVILAAALVLAAPILAIIYVRTIPFISSWWSPPTYKAASALSPDVVCRMRTIQYVASLPHEAKILALRPADMYHSGHQMVSYLDPRMIAFYKTTDPVAGLRVLKQLGVRYVQSTDYTLPVTYNSVLAEILGNPQYSKLVYSAGESGIFELQYDGQSAPALAFRDIGLERVGWDEVTRIALPGNMQVPLWSRNIQPGFAPSQAFMPIFLRDQLFSQVTPTFGITSPNDEYVLRLRLHGSGFARISVMQTKRPYNKFTQTNVMDIVLDGEEREVQARFMLYRDAERMQIRIDQRAGSDIAIVGAKLATFQNDAVPDLPTLDEAKQCRG
ncbi:hypothetical protein L535_0129 [Bordetella bronchiseptica SBL-F6116]|uniref:hypothetical protein n=1 Tax=Bordetella bronchiseptica TaxID=518 RepID=UPI00045B7463|nr:hypothetical protein [Bordetella bronchiseptica]KCV35901.1 hypothetical protein L489_0164 [Bordetella bronchiseptica 00-P-2730]KDD99351.1 hypothetical protein L535_0129 [Bordetella bronchiseptica SBL-F6116]